jgi:hypothetical protein
MHWLDDSEGIDWAVQDIQAAMGMEESDGEE